MKRLGIALAAFGMGVAFAPPVASAGGLEFPAPGTVSLGRGGASFARPGDPMALLYNPANLAGMQGIQLSLQTHLAFYDACFQREGTYQEYSGEPGMADRNNGNRIRRVDEDPTFIEASAFNAAGAYPDAQLPEVCNSGPPGIVPELILTWRAHRKIGIGIGFGFGISEVRRSA